MSAGKEAARDIRYGRRGGRWVPDGATAVDFDRPCVMCGEPVTVESRDYHAGCCAARGGLAASGKPCNPVTFRDGVKRIDGCGYCYLGGRS